MTADWYDRLLARLERQRQEDMALAEALGMTVEEADADWTAPDPREGDA